MEQTDVNELYLRLCQSFCYSSSHIWNLNILKVKITCWWRWRNHFSGDWLYYSNWFYFQWFRFFHIFWLELMRFYIAKYITAIDIYMELLHLINLKFLKFIFQQKELMFCIIKMILSAFDLSLFWLGSPQFRKKLLMSWFTS